MERSRRDTISKKKQAETRLAALDAQLQSGKKRLDIFEVDEEEDVFEKVRLSWTFVGSVSLSRVALCLPRLCRKRMPYRFVPAVACVQLDENAYSGLVSKRRKELGGFVVGKKDTG